MPKGEVSKVAAKPAVKHENLLFLLAIFAVLLAGDLIWWQVRETGDAYDYSSASMSMIIISHSSEDQDLANLEKDLAELEKQLLLEAESE